MTGRPAVRVRQTRPEDFAAIQALTTMVYAGAPPWTERQLASHLAVFPEGQFVALAGEDGKVVGMAASLIILWDEYAITGDWRDFTAHGMFINHDPIRGRTLYGAEIMVHPDWQGFGVGKQLYAARRALAEAKGLLRIRAGARLRGYSRHAARLTPEAYVREVVCGNLVDPTLTFQLRQGFHVLAVVQSYLRNDPESLGYAAVIEWLNPAVATKQDYEAARRFGAGYQADGGSGDTS